MQIAELLLLNKGKYTRVFLIRTNELNQAIFEELFENTIDPDLVQEEAKDYFLLDREGIDEIFGNADDLIVTEDDQILIIGL